MVTHRKPQVKLQANAEVILLPVPSDILSGHMLFSQQSYQSTLSSHSNFQASHKTPHFHRNQRIIITYMTYQQFLF